MGFEASGRLARLFLGGGFSWQIPIGRIRGGFHPVRLARALLQGIEEAVGIIGLLLGNGDLICQLDLSPFGLIVFFINPLGIWEGVSFTFRGMVTSPFRGH